VLMVFMPQARSLAAAASSLFETAPPT
jgi:hypothetical protein